jgi:hypothetical protein
VRASQTDRIGISCRRPRRSGMVEVLLDEY